MYEFLDRRYAFALYNTCYEAGNVELVLEELEEIVKELETNDGLKKILRNPQINKYNKKRIFLEMFNDNIEEELMKFLLILIEKGRILYLREKYNQFRQIYLKRNKTIIVKVKSVVPLDENQRQAIKKKLEVKYEKTIIMEEEIDESLIGGILVIVGNEIIDGSIRSRLDGLREIAEGNVVNKYNYDEFNKELTANVSVKKFLSIEENENLRKWLKNFYKRKVVINEVIDNSIEEDMIVTIGEDIITKATIDKILGKDGQVKEAKKPEDYLVELEEKHKVIDANITTVVPLTEEEKNKLIERLEKFYKRKVVIHERIDESILGGVLVQIGDDVTDGTLKKKLRYVRSDI